MDLKLSNKRALITGSTSGIGTEIARMLAEEGVKVIVHGRDSERANRIADEIRAAGGEAAIALGDLSTDEGASEVAVAASEAFGGIDILVNNAGGSRGAQQTSWLATPADQWLAGYSQNALPAVRLAQALAPAMRDRGWGRLIQISSRNSIFPHAQGASYAAAKAALNNLTLSLSKALAGTGVTSIGVMPGLIHTPLADPWFLMLAKQQGSDDPVVGQQFALKNIVQQTVTRLGEARDIAAMVCFVASPLNDFMNGTTVRVDGGATPTV